MVIKVESLILKSLTNYILRFEHPLAVQKVKIFSLRPKNYVKNKKFEKFISFICKIKNISLRKNATQKKEILFFFKNKNDG